jgi:hypothetical protein
MASPQQSMPGFHWLVHCVDVLLPALLLPFTTDQSNPFFLFLFLGFVLAAAAYRWVSGRTVMTAVWSLVLPWMESISCERGSPGLCLYLVRRTHPTGDSAPNVGAHQQGIRSFQLNVRSFILPMAGIASPYAACITSSATQIYLHD